MNLLDKLELACTDKIPKGETLAWCDVNGNSIAWSELLDFVKLNIKSPVVVEQNDDTLSVWPTTEIEPTDENIPPIRRKLD